MARRGYANWKHAGDALFEGLEKLERDMVTACRKQIKLAYGEAGLVEYLVACQFALKEEEVFYGLVKKYFHASSDLRNAIGQYSAGILYLNGTHGQTKDEKLGVEFISKSAKAGCGMALFSKGMMLVEGKNGHEKNAVKANKLYHKALKDPVLKLFPNPHIGILHSLAQMRISGVGCSKSYSAALKHFRAAVEMDPARMDQEVIMQLQFLEAISGVELQREADLRNRRLKLAARKIKHQVLGDWVLLYQHYGFELSAQPNPNEVQVCLTHTGMVEWMERAGIIQTLPSDYPSISDPLPPLECERVGCQETEKKKTKMKKCTSCQAPYCGVTCQRNDWARHKPVCEAVQSSIGNELTSHEVEILKQDKGMLDQLLKIRIKIGLLEILNVVTNLAGCSHSDNSIPCGLECFQEKGSGSQTKHKYTLLGSSVVTEKQRKSAREVGIKLPNEFGKVRPCSTTRDDSINLAAEVASEDIPKKNDCDYLVVSLSHPMGSLVFSVLCNRLIDDLEGNCSCCSAGLRPEGGAHN